MKYYINTIKNENDREIGKSFKFGAYLNLDECMKDAEMMHLAGYSYIEIIDENSEIYCEYEN